MWGVWGWGGGVVPDLVGESGVASASGASSVTTPTGPSRICRHSLMVVRRRRIRDLFMSSYELRCFGCDLRFHYPLLIQAQEAQRSLERSAMPQWRRDDMDARGSTASSE